MKKKKTTSELINELTKQLFPAVDSSNVLIPVGRELFLNGQKVSRETINSLSSQAKSMKTLEVYKLLMKEMRYIAQDKLFNDSKTVGDIEAAKMVLWTIDVLEKKVDTLSKM
jgi:SOS response regulatory protein OraA/RecX